MRARHARRAAEDRTAHGIDRMLRNVETGRFERGLSALTAAGALVTAAEIFFEPAWSPLVAAGQREREP
jgi:hypothetical protein